MARPDNTRILELVEDLRRQWPMCSDDELGEMAESIIDSEGLTDEEIEQIILDVLNSDVGDGDAT